MILYLLAIVVGYLLGSIPGAYIVTRLSQGKDIRKLDTGNVGAGSVFRSVGILEGALVFLIDCGKGIATIFIAQYLDVPDFWVLGAGFAAILGHCYPVYLSFNGGQGIATTIGIFLMLDPVPIAVTIGVLAIVLFFNRRFFFRRLFFSICISAPFLPLFVWLFERSLMLTVYSFVIIVFLSAKNWQSFKRPLEPHKR